MPGDAGQGQKRPLSDLSPALPAAANGDAASAVATNQSPFAAVPANESAAASEGAASEERQSKRARGDLNGMPETASAPEGDEPAATAVEGSPAGVSPQTPVDPRQWSLHHLTKELQEGRKELDPFTLHK